MKSQLFTCLGKIRLTTHREAEKALFANEEKRHVDKGEMRTYRCPNCGGFHNGHLEPWSRKAEHGYRRGVMYFGVGGTLIKFTIGERIIES
jgi:hypothetical protein